jgi:hypothetical protein
MDSSASGMSQERTFGTCHEYASLRIDHLSDASFYAAAQDACRNSKTRVPKLKLSDEEQRLLSAPRDTGAVMEKLKLVYEEQEQKSKKTRLQRQASQFVNDFCDFTLRASGIVEILLPQSPEYTIMYGLLLILFKVGAAATVMR